jgi:hypothetical protein
LVCALPGHVITSTATVTPGSALLFRKDLEHEGLLVTAGAKEIVSLNVWCTRKVCPQVLLVTFPTGGASAGVGAGVGAGGPLSAASTGPSYALSASSIQAFPSCTLNNELRGPPVGAVGGVAGGSAGAGSASSGVVGAGGPEEDVPQVRWGRGRG